MTESVTAYKTSDGKLFEDPAQADEHEARIIAYRRVAALINSTQNPINMSSFGASDLTEYLVENRAEFISALSGEPEPVELSETPAEDDAEIEAQLASLQEHHVSLVEDEDGAPLPPELQPAPPAQPDDDIPF